MGREEALRELAAALKGGATVTIAAATGMGGIGKTQLAAEFAHRYGGYFAGGVYWLSFADPPAVPAQVAACGGAGALELRPDFGALTLEDQVRTVQAAWVQALPRLLVFDSCEDPELLKRWRPVSGGCRVLVTSRRGAWDRSLGLRVVALGLLTRAQSLELLHNCLGNVPVDDAILDAIAAELGDLPLALHLAGSFLDTTRHDVSPAVYLRQLRSPTLLDHPSLRGVVDGESPTDHERSVFRTFLLSYERLVPADPTDAAARALLARAAWFAPGEPIARDLLLATLNQSGGFQQTGGFQSRLLAFAKRVGRRRQAASEARALDGGTALHRLVALGLLEKEAAGAVRLHRLLAAFVRQLAPDHGAQTAVEETLLGRAQALNVAGYAAPLLPLQGHLRAVTDAAREREDARAVRLCNQLGYHLSCSGDYAGARPYYERALAISERVLGPDHPDTATDLNNLGLLLQNQGDYAGARPYLERALAIRERHLGMVHSDTVISLNNLGSLLQDQGDYAGSRRLKERVLASHERVLGPDHPNTATSLNNLGSLLRDQGDLAGARPYYERALAIRERVMLPDHPNTATSLNNLGNLLQDQGDYAGARPYLERALAISERVLGPDHPNTAHVLNNLGSLLEQGFSDYQGSQRLKERALAIRERVLGPDHPNTAQSLNNLATLLWTQGDLAGARPYLERALAIHERVLGPDHPNTATSLNNLGLLLQDRGDLAGARPYLERALAISERVFSSDHPATVTSLNNLATLLRAQGDLTGARPYLERALAISERHLGADHPTTTIIRTNLASLGW